MTESQTTMPAAAVSDEERRAFITQAASALGLALCGASVGALATSCETTTLKNENTGQTATLDVSRESALQAVGGAVSKRFGANNDGRSVIIIRLSGSEFLALTSVCAHLGCEVPPPSSPGGTMVCPCHGSTFSSKDGGVITGPASLSLKKFPASFSAATNILTISF